MKRAAKTATVTTQATILNNKNMKTVNKVDLFENFQAINLRKYRDSKTQVECYNLQQRIQMVFR